MTISNESRIECDHCGRGTMMTAVSIGPAIGLLSPPVRLPDGWVLIDQGLGHQGGAGTAELPKAVDVMVVGRTSFALVTGRPDLAAGPPPGPGRRRTRRNQGGDQRPGHLLPLGVRDDRPNLRDLWKARKRRRMTRRRTAMPEFDLKDLEVAKDLPGYSGGPAKVLKLTLEDQAGNTHQAEMFTMASTVLPSVGQKIEGEISESDYGPKFSRGGGKKGGGGFKRSPAETKAIQRQHSQEQALRREANMIAAGGRPYNEAQLRSVINWFEQDIASKDRSISWDGFSDDVPGDDSDLPWSGPTEEELRAKS